MSVVRPELGPTLPTLLGPRLRALPRAARLLLAAALALVVVLVVWAAALRGGDGGKRTVVVRAGVAFNFVYRAPFARLTPAGGDLAHVGGQGQSFVVRALHLPAYRGDAAGFLPVYTSELARSLPRTYPGFAVRGEGRANVNRTQGYELLYQFRRAGRLMYGLRIMLLPQSTARDGLELVLESPRTTSVSRFDAVGRNGPLKTSLRSFRLGTERP
jgi:hypothetical protein